MQKYVKSEDAIQVRLKFLLTKFPSLLLVSLIKDMLNRNWIKVINLYFYT